MLRQHRSSLPSGLAQPGCGRPASMLLASTARPQGWLPCRAEAGDPVNAWSGVLRTCGSGRLLSNPNPGVQGQDLLVFLEGHTRCAAGGAAGVGAAPAPEPQPETPAGSRLADGWSALAGLAVRPHMKTGFILGYLMPQAACSPFSPVPVVAPASASCPAHGSLTN